MTWLLLFGAFAGVSTLAHLFPASANMMLAPFSSLVVARDDVDAGSD